MLATEWYLSTGTSDIQGCALLSINDVQPQPTVCEKRTVTKKLVAELFRAAARVTLENG